MCREKDLRSRVVGALSGLIVGDALGVPVEFHNRETLQKDPVEGMRGWGTHHQPPGTWSDDSSLALCMVESILQKGWNLEDQGKRFCQWLYEGHLTPHGKVFDVGGSTKLALSRIRMGTPAVRAGGRSELDNGNGSLMRILPAALYFFQAPVETLVRVVSDASSLTHAHPRSRLACVIYSLVVRELLEGNGHKPTEQVVSQDGVRVREGVTDAVRRASVSLDILVRKYSIPLDMQKEFSHFSRILDGSLFDCAPDRIRSGGYVVDTLEASFWCVASSDSFSEAVLKAVNLGGDTDTTGAVTGGLAGALWGRESIPEEWFLALARSTELNSWISEFSTLLTRPVPFPDSYWVLPGKFLAGEYPRTKDDEKSRVKLQSLLNSGITAIADLTEEGEAPYGTPLKPYHSMMKEIASEQGARIMVERFPIPDGGTVNPDTLRRIHRWIDVALENGHSVYVHCWGGHGRTGLVVGTWLVEHGLLSHKTVLPGLKYLRRGISKPEYPSPETPAQRAMVENWTAGGK